MALVSSVTSPIVYLSIIYFSFKVYIFFLVSSFIWQALLPNDTKLGMQSVIGNVPDDLNPTSWSNQPKFTTAS